MAIGVRVSGRHEVSRDIAEHVHGEPYETADGATVIPVARVRMRSRGGKVADDAAGSRGIRTTVTPVGAYVVAQGKVSWQPAVDTTRIVFFGQVIGLAAAVIGTLAVLRRPPWPDLSPQGLAALPNRR
jgi:hypothetical protein